MKAIQMPQSARRIALATLVVISGICSSVAVADVIPGPALGLDGSVWSDTGIGFTALVNSTLTAFTYQNQGAADIIVLTNSSGTILDSIATPSGDGSYTASVNWALTAGDAYFLLQTVASNELFAAYGLTLPSDGQISITMGGTFGNSINDAVTDGEGWGANEYWAAFNSITTNSGSSAVPEPGSVALILPVAFALVWGIRRANS